jgi:predicted transcriptional regulator
MQADSVLNKYLKVRIPKPMEKRKRRPGGGRKPGEFGKLGAMMSLRLPEDLKARLQQAAERDGHTLNAELVRRLKASFESRAASTIAQELADTAARVARVMKQANWERDLSMHLKPWSKRGRHK